MRRNWVAIGTGLLALAAGAARGAAPASPTDNPQLYVVATAHLDTQWRWTVRQTIDEFLPATLHDNFQLFDKYPDYVFSFEGAFRYMLMKEYYPKEYERLKREIALGRWRVAGSWVDAVDTNIPSPESLIRHALYGNGFFRSEFGGTSRDVFLPDCFGFGYALPSIAAHCGLTGFSTQKLTWGSSVGVPFSIGRWEGVDGSTLIAALDPGEYVGRIRDDLSADSAVVATVQKQADRSGLHAAYMYFGTGDQGGAPTDSSVLWLERSIAGRGPVRVRSVGSDQLARDLASIAPEQESMRLPRYKGELLMTRHGTGCYTSEAAMKRFNRKNERLADAAERASVVAQWLGGATYPRAVLRAAWIRFLWHQFHDDLTGTSIPEAYLYSWNDEAISQNEFGSVLTDAAGAVSRALDTQVEGTPVVVFNPLSAARTDVVEANLRMPGGKASAAVVFGPDGREALSQSAPGPDGSTTVTFLASVPPVGFAVYDVRPAGRAGGPPSDLAVTDSTLENDRYRIRVDRDGDIASIRDKKADRETLAAPLALEFLADKPNRWAAWEVDYEALTARPEAVAGAPARIRIVERGPARAALEVVRTTAGSTVRQVIGLAAGAAGDRVTIDTEIDWRSRETLLKAAFPLAVSNEKATYDLGLGTIERGTDHKELYEVPAQEWADITNADGAYGVAVLNDCKYGWDKPDDHTLRLTLVRTPGVNDKWNWIADQRSMDLGRHKLAMAIFPHAGDWRAAQVPWAADRLNQPLLAFVTPRKTGPLGRSFSMVQVSSPAVAVRALKLAEESDEIVIRLEELSGSEQRDVSVRFARPIITAREVNGAEEETGRVDVRDGALMISFTPYHPRAFAVRLSPAPVTLAPPATRALDLPYNLVGISPCGVASSADFDGKGNSLPGDLLPDTLVREGIPFRFGPREPGRPNVVACRGQRIDLPAGPFRRLYLIAAAVGGDRSAAFRVGSTTDDLWIQDAEEPVGQWDNRLAGGVLQEDPDRIAPAYVKTAPIAWIGTHRHTRDGKREAYAYSHFCRYRIDLPPGATALTLPDDERIRVLAVTAADDDNADTSPAEPLYDVPARTSVAILPERVAFIDSTRVALRTPTPNASVFYTLDGSDPTARSAPYRGPFSVAATTTIRARAIAALRDSSFVAAATVTRLTLTPASTMRNPRPGLVRRYYEGEWQKLPEFGALTPNRTDVAGQVALGSFERPESFGLTFSGSIRVARDGLYTFHLWSDDGSALDLDGRPLADNDGLHSKEEKVASAALKAGFHEIRVRYFQGTGDAALELQIEGPGLSLQQVTPDALFHEEGAE